MKTTTSKAMSLKGNIKNLAKEKKVPPQIILQNFMFERFLQRLSLSEYRNNFIIKGGVLISCLVGLESRSTMDIDTTIKNYPLTEKDLKKIFEEIIGIQLNDNTVFLIKTIKPIREDDRYGGFRISIESHYDSIIVPISIDVTTGDVITPFPILRNFDCILEPKSSYQILTYPTETILAEKVETILSRERFNTRPRDFYDIFILTKTEKYDSSTFQKVLKETCIHRQSSDILNNSDSIISNIESSPEILQRWNKYQKENLYARDITFPVLINSLRTLINNQEAD